MVNMFRKINNGKYIRVICHYSIDLMNDNYTASQNCYYMIEGKCCNQLKINNVMTPGLIVFLPHDLYLSILFSLDTNMEYNHKTQTSQ